MLWNRESIDLGDFRPFYVAMIIIFLIKLTEPNFLSWYANTFVIKLLIKTKYWNCIAPLASSILENMDQNVEPCDDFYRFACGSFLKNTIIPDDKTSVNTFSVISDKLQKQLRSSIEEESQPNDPRPFRLMKTLYKTCMNKSRFINNNN